MPAHIFVVNDINYEICIQEGLAGIFKLDSKQTNELILSHMLLLREGDPVLFYIKGRQELQGIWRVAGAPFYDTTQVWKDRLYPYRVCIQAMEGHVFGNPLKLSDIYLLRDAGRVWNFHLMRNQRSPNAIIEITNAEFDAIYNEFLKINPGGGTRAETTPRRTYSGSSLLEQLSFQNSKRGVISPQFESTIMALLAKGLSEHNTIPAFCGYKDYIAYVQTDWGKEIDALLIYEHPFKEGQITSYDLIEVKKDRFGEDGLMQLLNYEAWFTQKRTNGDRNMVRSIAIAKSFHPEVIHYLEKRKKYENKQVLLFEYSIPTSYTLQLDQIGKLELYRLLDEGRAAAIEGRKRPLEDVMRDIRQEITDGKL